jgi:hypothetical protein
LKDKSRLALHERRKLRIWAGGQDSLPTPSYGSRTSETSASSPRCIYAKTEETSEVFGYFALEIKRNGPLL